MRLNLSTVSSLHVYQRLVFVHRRILLVMVNCYCQYLLPG